MPEERATQYAPSLLATPTVTVSHVASAAAAATPHLPRREPVAGPSAPPLLRRSNTSRLHPRTPSDSVSAAARADRDVFSADTANATPSVDTPPRAGALPPLVLPPVPRMPELSGLLEQLSVSPHVTPGELAPPLSSPAGIYPPALNADRQSPLLRTNTSFSWTPAPARESAGYFPGTSLFSRAAYACGCARALRHATCQTLIKIGRCST